MAIGLSTGLFRLLDQQGVEVAAMRFHSAALVRIRLYPNQPLSQYEADLWLLFADGVAVSVPIYCLASVSQDAEPITYTRYAFDEAQEVRSWWVYREGGRGDFRGSWSSTGRLPSACASRRGITLSSMTHAPWHDSHQPGLGHRKPTIWTLRTPPS